MVKKTPDSAFVLHIKWFLADEYLSIDPAAPRGTWDKVSTYETRKGSKKPFEYAARCEAFELTDSHINLTLRYLESDNVGAGNELWGCSTITLDFETGEYIATWADDKYKSYDGPVSCEIIDPSAESRFPEGVAAYRRHKALERDVALAELAKRARLASAGRLSCEVCDFDFNQTYGDLGMGYMEAHHAEPIAGMDGKGKTPLSAIRLVCPNCHRMLHLGPRLLTVDELRAIVQRNRRA